MNVIGSPSKRYGNFITKNGKLYIYKENPEDATNEQKHYIGEQVSIKECRETLETGEIQLILEYWYKGKRKERTISRGQLQKREFLKLMEYGVDAAESKVNHILNFLDRQEKEDAPLTYTHQSLGWSTHEDQLVFKHYEISGPAGIPSTYSGSFDVEPEGTFEAWQTNVEKHILKRPALEFALVLGFNATLNAYFAQNTNMDTLVVHIYGDSSTGKTTSTRIATSAFGRPTTTNGGLILTWNSTANALINNLNGVHGILLGIDEASMNGMKDFSKMIYQLAGGVEKSRLTAEIEQRKQGTWSGGLLSNAEHSLQLKSNQNSGLEVRLLEIGNEQWTESAAHADAIKEGLEQNYGHAGPMFASYLLEKDHTKLLERLKEHEKEIEEVMVMKDQLTGRLASKFAVILLTATLMNELFSFQVDVDAIRDFIVQHEQAKAEDRDIGKRAIDAIIPQVIQYRSFFEGRMLDRTTHECYGSIKEKPGYTEVAILKPKFEEWLAAAGFTDSSVVLRSLRDKDILDNEDGKNTRKRKLLDDTEEMSKSPKVVYVLKLEKGCLDNYKTEETVRSPKRITATLPMSSEDKIDLLFN